MSINSFSFIVFLSIVLLMTLLVDDYKRRNLILLIASFIFYGFASIKFSVLLIFYIITIYYAGLKKMTKAGVVSSVFLLAIFKYFNFFVESLSVIFGLSVTFFSIAAPLGISFYCFRGISYLVDIKREKIIAEKNICNLALYIAYFPEIISGPITRYRDLKPQILSYEKKLKNITDGLQIFLFGLLKKAVLADNLATFVSNVYGNPNIYSSLTILLAVIAYSLEIYLDFSGYSDMSIGVSKMFGFNIKKNFDMPYISRNVTEFWKRWHISLSSWLQEYLYYGLGGNRKGKARQFVNLFLTMTIGGLWHGADYTFVIWGSLQGMALIVHKISLNGKKYRDGNFVTNVLSVFATNCFIALSWIPFRASSMKEMISVLKRLFSFDKGVNYYNPWAIAVLVVVLFAYIYVANKNKHQEIHSFYPIQDLTTIKGMFVVFILMFVIVCFGYTGGSPFIYAAF